MTLAALIEESRIQREAWRYTNLEPYAKLVMAGRDSAGREDLLPEALPDLPPALTLHRLVFVDGVYHAKLSVLEALPYGFVSACERPCDLTATCCSLTLGGQTCLAIEPIELLFVNTAHGAATEAETRLKISLGASSRLTLIERHISVATNASVRQIHMEIELAAQAKLVHGKIVTGGILNEKSDALHFADTKVRVAAGAFYDAFGLIAGGKLTRCTADVALQGELAEARLLCVLLLRDAQQGDDVTLVRHEAPHTTSRQICKTVLNDKARGVFQGKVFVAKGAQKTDGYQLCRALLLSDKAEMDAKPELEIYADDVKCSHGTAIGDLDENALFYLLSRGIPPQAARAMLIEAFVMDLVEQLPVGELQAAIQNEVTQWLG